MRAMNSRKMGQISGRQATSEIDPMSWNEENEG